jgi:hypothetical protein
MNHGNTLTLGTNLFPLKMANTFHAAPLALVGLCAAAVALVLELSVSRGSWVALVQQRPVLVDVFPPTPAVSCELPHSWLWFLREGYQGPGRMLPYARCVPILARH